MGVPRVRGGSPEPVEWKGEVTGWWVRLWRGRVMTGTVVTAAGMPFVLATDLRHLPVWVVLLIVVGVIGAGMGADIWAEERMRRRRVRERMAGGMGTGASGISG